MLAKTLVYCINFDKCVQVTVDETDKIDRDSLETEEYVQCST